VRFYRVPPTNKPFRGPNVFWPLSEIEDQIGPDDTGLPGQIHGAPTSYDLGINYRPDLTGTHPFGAVEDFAGLTPVPAVQPPEPDCADDAGLNLALRPRVSLLFADGFFCDATLKLIVNEPLSSVALWCRVESLASYTIGQRIPLWTDSSGYGRHLVNPINSTRPIAFGPILDYTFALFEADWHLLPSSTFTLPSAEMSVYVAAKIFGFSPDSGPLVGRLGLAGGRALEVKDHVIEYEDASGIASIPRELDDVAITLWSVRRSSTSVRFGIDGLDLGDVPLAAPITGMTIEGIRYSPSTSPFETGLDCFEIAIFPFRTDDVQHSELVAYFRAKFNLQG